MEKILCLICNAEAAKYKCPKCLKPNCYVTCFKAHAETNCSQMAIETKIVEDRKPSRVNVFTTVDTVKTESLEELRRCDKIKELLTNPHLRNFLLEVDSASNPFNAMKLAMSEPIFLEFADECMTIISKNET